MAAGEDNKTFDLGVDLGGTKVAVCSSDFEKIDDVSERVMRFPSHITGSQEELVDTLFSSIDTYIENKCAGKLPRAIGFGLKDAVDNRKGYMAEMSFIRRLFSFAAGQSLSMNDMGSLLFLITTYMLLHWLSCNMERANVIKIFSI